MVEYKQLLFELINNGELRQTRNGLTRSIFGSRLEVNCNQVFPIVTSKKTNFKAIVGELLWFMRGDTNIKYLLDNGINIWNQNAYDFYCKNTPEYDRYTFEEYITLCKTLKRSELLFHASTLSFGDDYKFGDCGDIYGAFWHTQIVELLKNIQNEPHSRRHLLQTVDTSSLLYMFKFNQQALPPCHVLAQFYVNNGKLDLQVYQRSADVFLGVPFNISSYALLLNIMATACNLAPNRLIFNYGDLHLYESHLGQAKELLNRPHFPLPQLQINKKDDIFTYEIEDFTLINYQSGNYMPAEMVL